MFTAALDAKYFGKYIRKVQTCQIQANFAWSGKGQPFERTDWDQLLGNFAAVSDVPIICFAKELIEAYPEAKVILVERDLESWYESFDNAVIAATWNPLIMFISRYDKRYLGPLKDMSHRWING